MATPFLSEIRVFSFNYPPKGWAFCDGQSMAINQNQALFSLLGTNYGGDGISTFNLPNLQSRVALHMSANNSVGQVGGEAAHTLTTSEIPAHAHTVLAVSAAATTGVPESASFAQPVTQVGAVYSTSAPTGQMSPQAIMNAGGSQPHENRQPYLTLNFCIALSGIYPSRS